MHWLKALIPIMLMMTAGGPAAAGPAARYARERFRLTEVGAPTIALQVQRPRDLGSRADVVYVHGGTFGSDLSIFFPFGGQSSWADDLAAAGMTVWGFDFPGYGESDRYPPSGDLPAGAIEDAVLQLRRVVVAVRERNGDRPVVLVAHSRGAAVAARYAGDFPNDVKALALFAPIVLRRPDAAAAAPAKLPSHFPLTVWAQYRRFIEDVPRGHAPVLSDSDMQRWGPAFLASDPNAASREPASVMTPSGAVADISALWAGHALYDPARITAPTLVVRGEWDSLCTDNDARRLMEALKAEDKTYVTIKQATHMMHMEAQRGALYEQVNRFLARVVK